MNRPPAPLDPASGHFERFRSTGDPASIGALFDLAAPELMGLASHLAPSLACAEDLVQECFLVALAKAKKWDPARPVMPWLAGILIAESRKQRRRRGRAVEADRVREPEAPEGLSQALKGELLEAVERAVAAMPTKYGDVVRASLLEGESTLDLAKRLDRAPGTVRVQLHRGLEHLRRALPAGIGMGALGFVAIRGLAEVRSQLIREAAIVGPTLVATGVGTASITKATGVLMGTKGLVAAAAVVVALGIGLSQLGSDEAPQSVPPVPEARAADDGADDVELESLADPSDSRAVADVPADVDTTLPAAATEAAVKPTRTWLEGEVIANAAGVPEFELLIRAGASLDRIRREPLAGPGPFAFDITDLVAVDDPNELRLLAVVESSDFIPASAWCNKPETRANGDLVYRTKLSPQAILRTITGRLVTPDNQPVGAQAARPWVAFLPEKLEEPIEYQYLSFATVESDGTFELRITHRDPGHVVYTATGFAVGHRDTSLDFAGGEPLLECGDLVLPKGATITGRALEGGHAMPKGSVVVATPGYTATPWTMLTRQLRLAAGRSIHAECVAIVEDDGRFTLEGLEAGQTYGVIALPKTKGFRSVQPAIVEGSGTPVRAPSTGVDIDTGTMQVTLRVLADGRPVKGVNVRARPADGDPRQGVPAELLGGLYAGLKSHKKGEIKLRVASGSLTELLVSADGFQGQPLDIDTRTIESGAVIEVNLQQTLPMATLRVGIQSKVEIPGLDSATAFLMVFGTANAVRHVGPVPIKDGVMQFKGVPTTCQSARLVVNFPASLPLDDLPLAKLAGVDLHFPGLTDEEVREIVVRPDSYGRIELRLVGRDESLAPSFELVDPTSNTVRPRLLIPGESGHKVAFGITTDGPILLGTTLPPGRYTLRQVGQGYETGERVLDVVAGEVTRVTFQLERQDSR